MLRVRVPAWVYGGLAVILVGNVLDLVLTLWGLSAGAIVEANPLLAPLLERDPALAAAVKMGATAGGVTVLYLAYPHKQRLVALAMTFLIAATFLVLMLHANWLWHWSNL